MQALVYACTCACPQTKAKRVTMKYGDMITLQFQLRQRAMERRHKYTRHVMATFSKKLFMHLDYNSKRTSYIQFPLFQRKIMLELEINISNGNPMKNGFSKNKNRLILPGLIRVENILPSISNYIIFMVDSQKNDANVFNWKWFPFVIKFC